MEKPSVYVDTSIFSVIVARPSSNIIASANQRTTRVWWQNDANNFDLCASDAVYFEALEGDPEMARERIAYISTVRRVPVTAEAYEVGDALMVRGLLPTKARTDALHLGLTTVHGIEFLVTWNCKHLANAVLYKRIAREIEKLGYNAPRVCTPLELSGAKP